MHDPLVVAFEIRRPWPSRSRIADARPGRPRWRIKLRHECGRHCDHPPMTRDPFPWYKPSSYQSHWTLAGRGYYWPPLVTVWHREPGDHDSGTVCPHFARWRGPDDTWQSKTLNGWRFHIQHWHIQIPPLQELRRRLLTRCTWCGGRSTRRNPVNVSHQWDHEPRPWWRGAEGLYHHGCSSATSVTNRCVCDVPLVQGHNGAYGTCTGCGKSYHDQATWLGTRAAVRLAGMPTRSRPWSWPKDPATDVHAIRSRLAAEALELETIDEP